MAAPGAPLKQLAGDDAGPGTTVAGDLAGQRSGHGLQEVVDQLRIGRTGGVVLVRRRVEELHSRTIGPERASGRSG